MAARRLMFVLRLRWPGPVDHSLPSTVDHTLWGYGQLRSFFEVDHTRVMTSLTLVDHTRVKACFCHFGRYAIPLLFFPDHSWTILFLIRSSVSSENKWTPFKSVRLRKHFSKYPGHNLPSPNNIDFTWKNWCFLWVLEMRATQPSPELVKSLVFLSTSDEMH